MARTDTTPSKRTVSRARPVRQVLDTTMQTNTADGDRAYWERHARGYDRSLRVLNANLGRMQALTADALHGAGRVLEVAAGTGILTTTIAASAREVVATDYSDAMVRTLEARIRDAALTNVRCERADLYDLRYAPGEFDAVVAANVLHLVPDLPAALSALRRVLAPGGKLIVPTFCHDEKLLSAIVSRAIALTGFPAYRRFSSASLCRALEENGLRVTRQERLDGLIPISHVEGVFQAGP
jgi:phosphatidylethanolamine/phosphatidyl-N-methylethanolamine N-methyltransferase